MPSKAEQVCALVASILASQTSSLGVQAVYRDRDDALTREETPVILIELLDEDSRAFGDGGRIERKDEDTLRFQICICVRSAGWQQIADDVRVKAHALLMASEPVQALLSSSLRRDRAEWQSKSTDVPFGYCNQIYQCKYISSNWDLES